MDRLILNFHLDDPFKVDYDVHPQKSYAVLLYFQNENISYAEK